MRTLAASTDEELLVAGTATAFGEFYDRHARSVLGYFARRTGDPEAAADLTAETFASAIVAQRRFTAGGAPATAWLFAIASRRLADYQPYWAARAELLAKSGATEEARAAYALAIGLERDPAVRRFLQRRAASAGPA